MSASEENNPTPLVEPLTRREREILGLQAEGLTAPEIAERLHLALSSVKWYIQQLYGKLGVNDKQRALARARELGLLGGQAPAAAPAIKAAPKHNLPLQVTRFFGREAEITQLKARLAEHRLVTLAGSGGVGKTRLSLRVAEDLVGEYADGVWFVSLAPLTDPALVPQTVAATLDLRDDKVQAPREALINYMRPRQVLLLLDNCEHLLESCAQLADSLLHTCPRLTILASSREPLGVDGESVLAIPTLSFPAAGTTPQAAQLAEYAAVRLFTDRVHLTQPDYAVTASNAAAITRICQRLDGIPLALELAAARLRLLDTETLAARLDDAFGVLTGGSRTALPRQQTLRATMDWSYRLLRNDERLLLQRLSVFAGGCTLEAAEAVCSGAGLETGQVLDQLAALVDKSMVRTERQPGHDLRYFLLETVRQYAREKLNDSDDSRRLHTCHRDFYYSFAAATVPKLQTPESAIWELKLTAELFNLRQALAWSFEDLSQPEVGPHLLLLLVDLPWTSHQEAVDWAMRGVALCQSRSDISVRIHVKVLERATVVTAVEDPQTALTLALGAVELSRGLWPEDKDTLMWSLFSLAGVYTTEVPDFERAQAALDEAETILQGLGPDYYPAVEGMRVRAYFAAQRSWLAVYFGNYQETKTHTTEAIRLYEASGSFWFATGSYTRRGMACLYLGEYEEARENFLVAQRNVRIRFRGENVEVLGWLARLDLREGNLSQARSNCREGLRLAAGFADHRNIAFNLGVMAAIRAAQGQPARAARLSGAAAAARARLKRKPDDEASLEALLPGWRARPDAAAIQQAYEAGLAMSVEQAVAYALDEDQA